MRVLSILILIVGLSTNYVFGQDGPEDKVKRERKELSPEERADKRTDHMTEILALTPDQEEKVRAIQLAHAMEMEKIHAEMKVLKERAKEQRKKTKTSLDEVLTAEQKEKLEQEHEKRREEHQKKKKERCCQE